MSWDLFAFRYQETLASKGMRCEFFVPFFASFDNKFVELAHACPIRCMLIDDRDKRINTIYLDEYEFQQDLRIAIDKKVQHELSDPSNKAARFLNKIDENIIDLSIEKHEFLLTPN